MIDSLGICGEGNFLEKVFRIGAFYPSLPTLKAVFSALSDDISPVVHPVHQCSISPKIIEKSLPLRQSCFYAIINRLHKNCQWGLKRPFPYPTLQKLEGGWREKRPIKKGVHFVLQIIPNWLLFRISISNHLNLYTITNSISPFMLFFDKVLYLKTLYQKFLGEGVRQTHSHLHSP